MRTSLPIALAEETRAPHHASRPGTSKPRVEASVASAVKHEVGMTTGRLVDCNG